MFLRLVGLGYRRGRELLSKPPAVFGLTYLPIFLGMFNEPEEKIYALRRVASRLAIRFKIERQDLVIIYKIQGKTSTDGLVNDRKSQGIQKIQ